MMLCSDIYLDKTYPQLTFEYIPYCGLYEAHRLGQSLHQSQLFTPRVYESGNSPDLLNRHHVHQMVTSAPPTSGSSRHSDQAGVHHHQGKSWVVKKRKLRDCVFPLLARTFMSPQWNCQKSVLRCPRSTNLLRNEKLLRGIETCCAEQKPTAETYSSVLLSHSNFSVRSRFR